MENKDIHMGGTHPKVSQDARSSRGRQTVLELLVAFTFQFHLLEISIEYV